MSTTLLDPAIPGHPSAPRSDRQARLAVQPLSPHRRRIKIVVTGGYGAGKTTLVRAVSRLPAVTCDVTVTDAQLAGARRTTTSAIDFGRLDVRPRATAREVTVCLFATPGLSRFWPGLWPHIASGAAGAIVVVNPNDVAGCFTAIDHCEQLGLPFVVVLNLFDGAPAVSPADLRAALQVGQHVRIERRDLHHPGSAAAVVANLVEQILAP